MTVLDGLQGAEPGFRVPARCLFAQRVLAHMRSAEAAHGVAFGVMVSFSAIAFIAGSIEAACWLFLFNVLGNGYPVMLQRYNRGRIERLHRMRFNERND